MNLVQWVTSLLKREQPGERLPEAGLDRRAFLKLAGGSAAVAAALPMVDLEALIWTPKPIILAPGLDHLPSSLEFLTSETLAMYEKGSRRYYNNQYNKWDAKIGSRIVQMTESGGVLTRAEARKRVVAPIACALAEGPQPVNACETGLPIGYGVKAVALAQSKDYAVYGVRTHGKLTMQVKRK